MDTEDVTKLLQPHDKTLVDNELFLTDKQRKWFFR